MFPRLEYFYDGNVYSFQRQDLLSKSDSTIEFYPTIMLNTDSGSHTVNRSL